jgi:hypothetical protein
MAVDPPRVTPELTLLSRVAYRGREVTGPRPRGLLALLAGDLRSGGSTARLVEGLWPEEQPEHPAKALQVIVSRTRAQLGADVIASTSTGYRLSLADDQVDASAVLLRAAAAARHAQAGDHPALAEAEAGLALWDGAPDGTDAGPDDPVAALRAERASTYLSLARARALALASLGRHAEAAGPLAGHMVRRLRGSRPVVGSSRKMMRGSLAQVAQVGHHEQVLLAGEQVVHRGELAGDADRGPDRVRVPGQVMAGHPDLARVGPDQGGQDVHGGGLAGAVGAEQREDRSLGNLQVDAVQHQLVAERLAQPGRRDRRSGSVDGHPSLAWSLWP